MFGMGCSLDLVLFAQVWKPSSLRLSLNFDFYVFRKGYRKRQSSFGSTKAVLVESFHAVY